MSLPHVSVFFPAVKKFPRKHRSDPASNEKKYQRELKVGKEKGGSHRKSKGKVEEPLTNGTLQGHDSPPKLSVAVGKSPRTLESDGEELDLEHLKFNVASPESFMYSVLDSSVPQLFNYDSLENIHEKSGGSPAKGSPQARLGEDVMRGVSLSNALVVSTANRDGAGVTVTTAPELIKTEAGTLTASLIKRNREQVPVIPGKRGGPDLQATIQAKRQRLETALSNITPRQPVASFQAAIKAAAQQSLSQPGSLLNSPESVAGALSAYASQEATPYATPHGTPAQSPLPSPSPSHHHHAHMFSQTSPPPLAQPAHAGHMTFTSTASGFVWSPPQTSTVNHVNLPGFCPQTNNILFPGQPSTIFLNSPFRVVPVAGSSLLPLVQLTNPLSQNALHLQEADGQPYVQKSPFTVVPIPHTNRTQTEVCKGIF